MIDFSKTEGVPVYIRPQLAPGTINLYHKDTPQVYIEADSYETLHAAIERYKHMVLCTNCQQEIHQFGETWTHVHSGQEICPLKATPAANSYEHHKQGCARCKAVEYRIFGAERCATGKALVPFALHGWPEMLPLSEALKSRGILNTPGVATNAIAGGPQRRGVK